jgi:hypothetical protein
MMTSLPSEILQRPPATEASLPGESSDRFARVCEVDPLKDRRWQAFLQLHPQSSVFHSVGWLSSLSRTYGYEPVVYTTSPASSELKNGLLFCRIQSWATGNRLVSLPFSDHCTPLCDPEEEFSSLIAPLQTSRSLQKWKYLEVRPANRAFGQGMEKLGFKLSAKYVFHCMDLRPTSQEIFRRLKQSAVQRRVLRAERAGVVEVCGKSQSLLREFYKLMVCTRARHNLPPQPFAWFRNLVDCMGDALNLRLAYVKGVPAAAVVVLHFKETSYYKYGCSNEKFHHLGVVPFLLWHAIVHAKSIGSKVFDLGRTAEDNQGLLAFKNNWASTIDSLSYWKFPGHSSTGVGNGWNLKMLNRICTHMPHRLLQAVGTWTYRHVG